MMKHVIECLVFFVMGGVVGYVCLIKPELDRIKHDHSDLLPKPGSKKEDR